MTMTPARPAPRITGLARFHAAQSRTYPKVIREIQRGDKQTHWMWFIFPQHRGLARSDMATRFGIADQAEAAAYLADRTLRIRLFECTMGVLGHDRLMFPYPDNRKLQSCMTLFRAVADDPSLPNAVLTKFFDGKPDQNTLDLLAGKPVTLKPARAARGIDMARHWEKQISQAQAVATSAGRDRRRERDPWSRERVASFVKGFGLSTVATRQMVDAWMADQARAQREGWEVGHDEGATDAWDQQQH